MKIYAKHAPYEDGHLGDVVAVMRAAGAPTIKCVRFDGDLFAVEGSHRLAAAKYLGLTPIVDETAADSDWPPQIGGWWRQVRETLPMYEF